MLKIASVIPAGGQTLSPAPCQVIEWCLLLSTDDGPGETSDKACVFLDELGFGTDGVEACVDGGPEWARGWRVIDDPGSGAWHYEADIKLNAGVGTDWRFNWVQQNSFGANPGTTFFGYQPMTDGVQHYSSPLIGSAFGTSPVLGIVVVEYSHVNAVANPVWQGGDIGKTRPSTCLYWFGPKMYDDPVSDIDEPAGVLLGGGDPDPVGVTDPPAIGAEQELIADEASWWKKMLAGLGVIAAAVLAVPALILSGLGAVLTELFVPSQAFMGAQTASVQTAWDGTSPAKYQTAITGQVFSGSASGCSGLPVAWSMSGETYSFTLLAACSGIMATVAAVCKLVLTAGLVLFGGLTCLRALGSGLGWNPGVGRGESV